jgi:hypothetical protein
MLEMTITDASARCRPSSASSSSRSRCGLEEGQQRDGREVDGCDVGRVGRVPGFEGLVVPELGAQVGGGFGVGFGFGSGYACCSDCVTVGE